MFIKTALALAILAGTAAGAIAAPKSYSNNPAHAIQLLLRLSEPGQMPVVGTSSDEQNQRQCRRQEKIDGLMTPIFRKDPVFGEARCEDEWKDIGLAIGDETVDSIDNTTAPVDPIR